MALGMGARHLMQEAVVWGGVLGAGFTGVYYFDEVRNFIGDTTRMAVSTYEESTTPQQISSEGFERTVTLRANSGGHFAVRANINGNPVSLLADTGATLVMLTYEDARDLGFSDSEIQYNTTTRTANGTGKVARIQLDRVEVGDIMVRDVQALVAEPGKLHVNLLGMSFIGKLTRFELRGRQLILIQ